MNAKNENGLEFIPVSQPKNVKLYSDKIERMSKSTALIYGRRWNEFLAQQEQDQPLISKIQAVGKYLIDSYVSKSLAPATLRSYKAAILYGLGYTCKLLIADKIDQKEKQAGLSLNSLNSIYLYILNNAVAKGGTSDANDDEDEISGVEDKRTSASKLKYFPKPFFEYLEEQSIRNKKSEGFLTMYYFVRANLLLGFRPNEWSDVSISQNIKTREYVLTVKNSKDSMGRANGEYRTLHLKHATETQLADIARFTRYWEIYITKAVKATQVKQVQFEATDAFSQRMESEGHLLKEGDRFTFYKAYTYFDLFDEYGNPSGAFISIVLNKLGKFMYREYKRYMDFSGVYTTEKCALYSTRHQCVANAKASGLNKYILAAFFGHAGKSTAEKHYGKPWNGWSKFRFRPDIESVKLVHGVDAGNEMTMRQLLNMLSASEENAVSTSENMVKNLSGDYDNSDDLFSNLY